MATCWSDLPDDLVTSIGKRLNTKIKVSVFRAVCKSWRSYIHALKKRPLFPIRLQAPLNGGLDYLTISESIAYRLELASTSTSNDKDCCWLIKVTRGDEEHNQLGKIMHVLSAGDADPPPKTFNLLDFRVFESTRAYALWFRSQVNTRKYSNEYQVAVSLNSDCPTITTVTRGRLYCYRLNDHIDEGILCYGESICKCNCNDEITYFYLDVICCGDKFYANRSYLKPRIKELLEIVKFDYEAVKFEYEAAMSEPFKSEYETVEFDSNFNVARTIMFPPSCRRLYEWKLPASAIPDLKFWDNYLMESSSGELLLATVFTQTFKGGHPAKCRLYTSKLEKEWVDVELDLNDRILFICHDCRFFVFPEGKCISIPKKTCRLNHSTFDFFVD